MLEFGKIIEIKNCRAGSLKGQAWVVFKDIPSATEAMNRRQGFNFYGKPLVSPDIKLHLSSASN